MKSGRINRRIVHFIKVNSFLFGDGGDHSHELREGFLLIDEDVVVLGRVSLALVRVLGKVYLVEKQYLHVLLEGKLQSTSSKSPFSFVLRRVL